MSNEQWSRDYALETLRDNISGLLDSFYDDEAQMFFDVLSGGEYLIVTVTDATDDSLSEEFVINFE